MIIYSVTVNINDEVETEWVQYMNTTHIPEVMSKGFFTSFTFAKLLDPILEPGSATYNIQYFCESPQRLEVYRNEAAPALQADHTARFKDKFVAFRSVLELK
jgi:Domain of unknown function (DUF4286)